MCAQTQLPRADFRAEGGKPEMDQQIAGGSVWTILSYNLQGDPQCYEIYLQELGQVPTVSKANPPVLLSGKGGKKPLRNTPEHFVLLQMACPQGKPVNQSLTCWGIIRG